MSAKVVTKTYRAKSTQKANEREKDSRLEGKQVYRENTIGVIGLETKRKPLTKRGVVGRRSSIV